MATDKEVILGAVRGNVQRSRVAAMLQVLNIVIVAKRLQESIAKDETTDGAQTRKECLENLVVSIANVSTLVGILEANLDVVEGIKTSDQKEALEKEALDATLGSSVVVLDLSELPLYTDEANEDTEDFVEDSPTD